MRQIPEYQLWLGHVGSANDLTALLDAGIQAVVDLAINEPPLRLTREMVYCRFPLVDGAGNEAWLIRAAVETVAGFLRNNVPTLIYCSAGMSRTPAIAGAAIARVSGYSLQEGLMIATRSGVSDVSPVLWLSIELALECG